MTQLDTNRFRTMLLEERQRVVEAISYLHEETPGSLEDETDEPAIDNHPADVASATLDREAQDVVTFLAWAAEPELETRKAFGVRTILFLLLLTGLLYAVKRRVWAKLH